MRILAHATGRFGHLTVVEDDGLRALDCDQARLGSAWLDPATGTPSVLPAANYLLGWLVALADRPHGRVLMAGLGCGAGPVALLAAFPGLTVTVAEIDPVVTDLARTWFPAVAEAEAAGRLEIRTEDILDTVRQAEQTWDVACLDAFVDDQALDCPPDLLGGLHGRAEDLWLNLLDDDGAMAVAAYADLLERCGWPARAVLPIHDGDDHAGNVLLGTRRPAKAALRAWTPFAGLDHPRADAVRRDLRILCQRLAPWG